MWQRFRGIKLFGFLGLFTSLGTLLCCAIPSTLVLLGFGASLAGFLGKFPQFIWFSENKVLIFSVSFSFLFLSWGAQKFSQTQRCPVDKKEDCSQTKRWSKILFLLSLGINLVGAFYAFILPGLL